MSIRTEDLGHGVTVYTDADHRVGTDACLLADFAAPRKTDTACDLGTGCGVIPLLWFAGESPPVAAYALELQPEAAELARMGAAHSGLEERLHVLEGDIRELPDILPWGDFDLVTCNPPYKAAGAGVLSAGDSGRIARHETMCTLDDVCGAAGRLLRFGGRLCVCQRPERLTDLLCAMRAHRIEPKRLRFVHKDAHSPPWLVLCEGRLGSKPFLQVEAPLLLDGRQTTAGYGSGVDSR